MKTAINFRNAILILMVTACLQPTACTFHNRNQTAHRFQSYTFNQNSSLLSRVSTPPDFLVSFLKKMDKRNDYQPYTPTAKEMKIIEQSLASLPPLHKRLLSKKLIGIYFITNFYGNGLTDWVLDSSSSVYTIMVFNSSVLSTDISTLLTRKERTCFIHDDPSIDITVDCGTRYSGFDYILLHESTHAVDYIQSITPYVDLEFKRYVTHKNAETACTRNIWSDYATPREHFLFTGRVFFYGIRAPRLRYSEAVALYQDLARSPFVSLYSTMNWAEDCAELAAFYHITHVLKQPFVIKVRKKGGTSYLIRPMESPKVKERLAQLSIMYTPEKQ